MKCEAFRELLFDYLRGRVADGAAFREHRASCPACAATLLGIEENERVLGAARVPAAPADLWPRIAAAISASRPVAFRRPRLAALAAAAAAILLVVALFFSGGAAPPRLEIVIQEIGPEARRTFGTLVPRYEDVDAATAMVDTLLRSDY